MGSQTQIHAAIDGRMLGASATGVATYAEALLAALRLEGAPPLILNDRSSGRGLATANTVERWVRWLDVRHVRSRTVRPRSDGLWYRDIFRLAHVHFDTHGTLLTLRPPPGAPRIMHWTYPIAARIEGWINLYTIHDLIPIERSDLSPIDGRRLEAIIRLIARDGGRLMTVSEASRRSLDTLLGPDVPIHACATGIDLPGRTPNRSGAVPEGSFVMIGSVEPRKNIERLIDAWEAGNRGRRLAIIGPTGWRGEAIEERLRQSPDIIRLLYLERGQLLAALACARALLFPSLAEGFGLPIVEAMALGVPVMASDAGATGEIMDGAGLPIDPLDTRSIASAIDRLDRDDDLCATLAAAGRIRAQAFTIEAFAARLATVHRAIIGDSE